MSVSGASTKQVDINPSEQKADCDIYVLWYIYIYTDIYQSMNNLVDSRWR